MTTFKNSPYVDIPQELIAQFTLNGTIPVANWWFDGSKKTQIEWTSIYIDEFVKNFSLKNIEENIPLHEPYPNASRLLLAALEKFQIKSQNIAVIGSETPWIEAILLNLNNTVTTVEYNTPNCSDPRIKCISYDDFCSTDYQYDCVVSYSSIEHSGLGRYGDALNPNGDIETMEQVHKKLIDNGLFIWGAPVGQDALVWNAHRIYGPRRLPVLFEKFHELAWFGFNKNDLFTLPLECCRQPVVALRKK